MSVENIIEVKNLFKKYKGAEKNSVDGISFNVKQGEFFAFLGPNGAGKTTTISILTTTLAPTSGEIKIAGFDLEKDQNSVRKNIGVIFQNPSLDVNLTAEENLRMHAILYGLFPFRPLFRLMPEEYKKRVKELGDVLDLKEEIFRPLKTFSGGMKRKLEIIRTLLHKPKILFLDEPSSGLDPLSRKNLWNYLKEVREKEGTTVFLTTHYLDEAEDADNVCVINEGKIVVQGTPSSIKEELIDEVLEINSRDRKSLEQELDSKGIKYRNSDVIQIDLKNMDVHSLIKGIETKLDVIKVLKPTLEEAYIQIVERKEEK